MSEASCDLIKNKSYFYEEHSNNSFLKSELCCLTDYAIGTSGVARLRAIVA